MPSECFLLHLGVLPEGGPRWHSEINLGKKMAPHIRNQGQQSAEPEVVSTVPTKKLWQPLYSSSGEAAVGLALCSPGGGTHGGKSASLVPGLTESLGLGAGAAHGGASLQRRMAEAWRGCVHMCPAVLLYCSRGARERTSMDPRAHTRRVSLPVTKPSEAPPPSCFLSCPC